MSIAKKINIFTISLALLCIISNIFSVFSSFSSLNSSRNLDELYLTANELLSEVSVNVNETSSLLLQYVTQKKDEDLSKLKQISESPALTNYIKFITQHKNEFKLLNDTYNTSSEYFNSYKMHVQQSYNIFSGFASKGVDFLKRLDKTRNLVYEINKTANDNARNFLEQDIDTRIYYANFLNSLSTMKEDINKVQNDANQILSGTNTNELLFENIGKDLLTLRKSAQELYNVSRVESNRKLLNTILENVNEMIKIARQVSPTFKVYVKAFIDAREAGDVISADLLTMSSALNDI